MIGPSIVSRIARAFVVAGGQQQALARFEDRAHAHRDGQSRHFLLAAEEAGVVAHGFGGQRLEPRAAAQRRARLVEGDVAVAADAQHLQVDAAFVGDHPFVLLAIGLEIQSPAVGHVRVARVDVDVIEQVLLHEVAIALRMRAARPTYSSRLNVTTREKSRSSSRCMRINSAYIPSGVLPVASPSTQVGRRRTRSATNWAARRLTPSLSCSTITRIERFAPGRRSHGLPQAVRIQL